MAIKKRSGFENEDIIAKAKALTDYVLSIKAGFETINFTNLQPFKEFQSSLLDFAKILPKPVATAEIAKAFLPLTDYTRILEKMSLTPIDMTKRLLEGLRVEIPYPMPSGFTRGNVPDKYTLTDTVIVKQNDSLFAEESTVVTEIELDKESKEALANPNAKIQTLHGITKRIVFNKYTGLITLKGIPPIKIKKNTPMFEACRILFCNRSNVGKEWSSDDIKEKLGLKDRFVSNGVIYKNERIRGGSGKSRDRKVYDLVRNLNVKIGIKNFIVFNNKWVTLNPQYAEYYK